MYGQRLSKFDTLPEETLSFTERFYLYQAYAWYHYILHNMLLCYKYVRHWIALFDEHPQMKRLMFDAYMRGYSRLLDSLFLLRSYKRFAQTLNTFEQEIAGIDNVSDNSRMIAQMGITPDIRFGCPDGLAAMAMVKAGLGIAIMNQLIVDSLEPGGEVRVMPLDPEQYVDIGIGVTRKDMISPAAARFIAYAKEHIEEMK